jgi:glycosyltransferase involved in cell wall biosynthesis
MAPKMTNARTAIIVPIGPGAETALDTLQSIESYCTESHEIIIVDDCTQDGTYQLLLSKARQNWRVLRNSRRFGVLRLVHSLSSAYRHVISDTQCDVVFRIDQDALVIREGVITEALAFIDQNPSIGLFGVYSHDYNRSRSFDMHRQQIRREISWPKALLGLRPSWRELLRVAERRGYRRGDNVFGAAYFMTRKCLDAIANLGALEVPYRWHSQLMEDVYYSMATVAAGFELGHFGAPEGPLCLEWRGLPYPAAELLRAGYKVVHSVDKGKNTNCEVNGGMTAREFFRRVRKSADTAAGVSMSQQ